MNAMKVRDIREIEIRDKMVILFNMLLARLGEEYKEKKWEAMKEQEEML